MCDVCFRRMLLPPGVREMAWQCCQCWSVHVHEPSEMQEWKLFTCKRVCTRWTIKSTVTHAHKIAAQPPAGSFRGWLFFCMPKYVCFRCDQRYLAWSLIIYSAGLSIHCFSENVFFVPSPFALWRLTARRWNRIVDRSAFSPVSETKFSQLCHATAAFSFCWIHFRKWQNSIFFAIFSFLFFLFRFRTKLQNFNWKEYWMRFLFANLCSLLPLLLFVRSFYVADAIVCDERVRRVAPEPKICFALAVDLPAWVMNWTGQYARNTFHFRQHDSSRICIRVEPIALSLTIRLCRIGAKPNYIDRMWVQVRAPVAICCIQRIQVLQAKLWCGRQPMVDGGTFVATLAVCAIVFIAHQIICNVVNEHSAAPLFYF